MRKKKWVRREAPSASHIVAAVTAFVILLAILGFATIRIIEGGPFAGGPGYLGWSNQAIAVAIAFDVILAYLGARLFLLVQSYDRKVDPAETCTQCEYNLTGNESGICPECGTRQVTSCGKCGYDLTGNESGRCPECGSTGEIEFEPDSLFFAGSRTLKWILAALLIWTSYILIVVGSTLVGIFTVSFFPSALQGYCSLFASFVVPPILAIAHRKASKSKSASRVSSVVLLLSFLHAVTLVLLFANLITTIPESVSALIWFPAMAVVYGAHVVAAHFCGRIPSKWCARGSAAAAFLIVLMCCWVQVMAVIFPRGGMGFGLLLMLFIIGFPAASGLSMGIASIKLWKLLKMRVHYEKTGEWPRY